MKKKSIALKILLCMGFYLLLTALFGVSALIEAPDKFITFLRQLSNLWWLKLLIITVAAVVMYFILKPPLDIKARKVGDGQHGDAQYMEEEEKSKTFLRVPFGKERVPGFVVGIEAGCWLIDTSDNNMLLVAPPGSGKTTGEYIPTITYNARVFANTGDWASLLMLDIKGVLYDTCAPELQANGWRTPVLNLRDVFASLPFNIMHQVNREIDAYRYARTNKEKAIHYGKAERYAKIVASSIFDSGGRVHSSEGSEYFNSTAKGLVTGLMLLVSEHAPEDARHIVAVYDLIIQLNRTDEAASESGVQKSSLTIMMDNITNRRVKYHVGGASGADIRTTLNIFSSALSKMIQFVDAELEQLLCTHSEEFEARSFIENPTAIFIICPDENPTRHFMASLFISLLSKDLIEIAENEYKGVMPHQFFFMVDEFGNMPPLESVVSLFSAVRSRGGRFLASVQSYAQLLDKYSREQAEIIQDTCQMLMFSFVAPSAESTATRLSKMLGNETILTGSASVTQGNVTSSTQMTGRPLLSPAQLVKLGKGVFITMKGTHNPFRGNLKGYWEYLNLATELINPLPQLEYREVVVVSASYIEMAASVHAVKLKVGMFDD